MSLAFRRAADRRHRAVQSMIVELARSSSAADILRDPPIGVLLMTPRERARFVALRGRIVQGRSGRFERALRRFGRWLDSLPARRQ